jgi:sulfite reductase (NADPH) flavoprotein alpha-component
MINENNSKTKVHLFWGGRTKKSFEIYKKNIDDALKSKKLISFYATYSQEQHEQKYVQDLLKNYPNLIANTLNSDNVIMICGSIPMQNGVLKLLKEISEIKVKTSLKKLKNNNQIKTDCY